MTQEEKIKEAIELCGPIHSIDPSVTTIKELIATELNRKMEEVLKELNIEYSKLNLIMSQYTFDSDMKHSVKTGYGWAIDKVKSLLNVTNESKQNEQ